MEHYVGVDVSLKETAVCVIGGEGNRVWQGTCVSAPNEMESVIRKRAQCALRSKQVRCVFNIGMLFAT